MFNLNGYTCQMPFGGTLLPLVLLTLLIIIYSQQSQQKHSHHAHQRSLLVVTVHLISVCCWWCILLPQFSVFPSPPIQPTILSMEVNWTEQPSHTD